MKVRFTRGAREDLTTILSYVHEQSPQGARNLLAAIERAFELLARHAEVGQATDRPPIRLLLVPRFPYKIFYRAKNAEIEIIHVRHAARRPWMGD